MSYSKLTLNCSDRRVRPVILKDNCVDAFKEVVKNNPDFYISGLVEPIEKDWKLISKQLHCYYSLELGFSVLCFGMAPIPAGNFPAFSKTKTPIQKYAVVTEIEELFYQAETQFLNNPEISSIDFDFTGEMPVQKNTQESTLSQQQVNKIIDFMEHKNTPLSNEQKETLKQLI
ncbi:hypothetical protein [Aeromonas phage AerS_266]|nr:hypothetical protein [Aeromonas phage AerS_266]